MWTFESSLDFLLCFSNILSSLCSLIVLSWAGPARPHHVPSLFPLPYLSAICPSVASAGLTPISAPTFVHSGSLRSGYHLHSVHHDTQSWRLRSAPPSLCLSFNLASFHNHTPPLALPFRQQRVCYGCIVVHTLSPLLLSTTVGPQHSCPHHCLHIIVVPPQSCLLAFRLCLQHSCLIIWGHFCIF